VINNKGGEINNLLKERIYAYSIGVKSNPKELIIVTTKAS